MLLQGYHANCKVVYKVRFLSVAEKKSSNNKNRFVLFRYRSIIINLKMTFFFYVWFTKIETFPLPFLPFFLAIWCWIWQPHINLVVWNFLFPGMRSTFFSWQQNKSWLPWKYICISAQSVRNTKLIVVEEPSPQIALLSFVRYRYKNNFLTCMSGEVSWKN